MRSPRRRAAARRGLFLVELTVALAILAVAGTVIVSSLHSQARMLRLMFEERAAWEFAGELMERVETGQEELTAPGPREAPIDCPDGNPLREARRTLSLETTPEGARVARIVVSWKAAGGGTGRVELHAVVGAAR